MDEIEQFKRRAAESEDLFYRGLTAYPSKYPKQLELKTRRENGDKNVVVYQHSDTDREYRLVFTEDQISELEKAYLAARTEAGTAHSDVEREAALFVGILSKWPSYMLSLEQLEPDTQKERGLVLGRIENYITKLDQALDELDSAALGYWYAHVTDSLAKAGYQLSESDNQVTSMVQLPMRAMVEGGEFRKKMRAMTGVIARATTEAKNTLPKSDRVLNDPRKVQASQLEKQIVKHRIPFDTSETGFPAKCLRTVFDVAGIEVEKVSYWLKKAEDDPDSEAKFLKRMADRYAEE